MDPLSLILSALAVAGAKVGGQAIQDAYGALRSLLMRKFGPGNPRLGERIDDYVADQETFRKPAAKALHEVGADADAEVVERARDLLRKAEELEPAATSALVNQINAKNVVVAQQIIGDVTQSSGSAGQP